MRIILALVCGVFAGCAYHQPTAPSAEPIPVVVIQPPPASTTPLPVIVPPLLTVDIAATPSQPVIGEAIAFTVSSGNGQAPLSYGWTFGDGSTASGSDTARTHSYPSDGVKVIRVIVTDANGRTGTGSREIDVRRVPVVSQSQPPVVIPPSPPPPTPLPSLSATLTCTPLAHGSASPCNVNASYGSVLLPSAAITGVAYDWGDGVSTSNGVVSTHTYLNAGSYHVFATVTATTVDGAKTVVTTQAIDVP